MQVFACLMPRCGCCGFYGNSEEALHGRNPPTPCVFCLKDTQLCVVLVKLPSVLPPRASVTFFRSRRPSVNNIPQPAGLCGVVRNSNNTPLGAVRNDLRRVSGCFSRDFSPFLQMDLISVKRASGLLATFIAPSIPFTRQTTARSGRMETRNNVLP